MLLLLLSSWSLLVVPHLLPLQLQLLLLPAMMLLTPQLLLLQLPHCCLQALLPVLPCCPALQWLPLMCPAMLLIGSCPLQPHPCCKCPQLLLLGPALLLPPSLLLLLFFLHVAQCHTCAAAPPLGQWATWNHTACSKGGWLVVQPACCTRHVKPCFADLLRCCI